MFIRSLILIVGVIYGLNASAQDFLDGWYFNPSQPGSGFNVNQQADVTAIALFDFTVAGDTMWATAVDELDILQNGDEVFEAELFEPENGACFDCVYQPNSGNVGGDTVRIVFEIEPNAAGNLVARVTLRGTTEIYEQLLFRFASPLDFMLSDWTLTAFGELPDNVINPLTEIISFDSVGVDSNGSRFVAGRLRSRPDSVAVARLLPEAQFGRGQLGILADNINGNQEQFWLFLVFKETLLGDTSIAADAIMDILVSPDFEFTGHRVAATINRNDAIVIPQVEGLRAQSAKPDIKPATPEMIALADRLAERLAGM